jgi:PST family polysaccharide transporter
MLKPLLTIGALQLAAMVVMLVRTKLLAVLLGPEGVGVMAVVDKLLALFAQAVSLSLPFAALRFLPEPWRRDRTACYASFRAMAFTLLALSALAGLGGAWLSGWHAAIWGVQLSAYPATLVAAFLSLPALALWPLIQNAYAGTLRHHESMVFLVGHAVVLTLTAAVGAFMGSLAVLYLCYAAAAWLLFMPALLRVVRPMRPEGGLPFSGWRSLLPETRVLRFSLALVGLTVLAPFAALYTHYWILDQQGAQAAGWMQAAIGISLAVRGVLSAGHQVYLTPHLNSGGSWADRMQWAGRFQHTWCLLAGLLVPPLLLGAEWAVRLLYAEAFAPATRFVALFVLTEVVGMLAGTYQGVIVAADRMRFHVAQNAAAQALLIAVAWLAIPRWGIGGAALAGLAAQVLLLLCTLAFLRVRMGLRPATRTLALMLYLVVALAFAGWFGAQGLEMTRGSLANAAAIQALIVIGLLAFVSADERGRAREIFARFVRRR